MLFLVDNLKGMLKDFNRTREKFRVTINERKTKNMTISVMSRIAQITIANDSFEILDSLIRKNRRCN